MAVSNITLKIERRASPAWLRASLPALAVLITFTLTSFLVLAAGANPLEALYYFILEPLTSQVSLFEVLVKATPLLLTGIAVALAFSGGFWNIGAEGQFLAGATAATAVGLALDQVPAPLAIPCTLSAGVLGGMAWIALPALMKTRLGVDEVVTTLLLNSVALFAVSALLNGPWRDPISQWPQSPDIATTAVLPKLVPRSRLHLGFVLALLLVVVLSIVITRTASGVRLRAVGMAAEAARFAGIDVQRVMLTTALLSGGGAGLAGAIEVAGIHYHLIEAISGGQGYTGIVIATLSGLNPWAVLPAALFIGLIDTGSQTVSRALGVPVYLGEVIQATLLLVTLALLILQSYRIRLERKAA